MVVTTLISVGLKIRDIAYYQMMCALMCNRAQEICDMTFCHQQSSITACQVHYNWLTPHRLDEVVSFGSKPSNLATWVSLYIDVASKPSLNYILQFVECFLTLYI